jgi:hypothetical protein
LCNAYKSSALLAFSEAFNFLESIKKIPVRARLPDTYCTKPMSSAMNEDLASFSRKKAPQRKCHRPWFCHGEPAKTSNALYQCALALRDEYCAVLQEQTYCRHNLSTVSRLIRVTAQSVLGFELQLFAAMLTGLDDARRPPQELTRPIWTAKDAAVALSATALLTTMRIRLRSRPDARQGELQGHRIR